MKVPPDDVSNDIQEILELTGTQANGAPKGLTRCRACGDWKGRCLWPDPLLWNKGPTKVSCRCDPNVCQKCGAPIYEYRLGSNVYNEITRRVEHVPGMIGCLHRCGRPWIELPYPIQPFWDEKYSPVLAGFPVQLVYFGVRPRDDETRKPIVAKACYHFAPETFFETEDAKQMRYRSVLASRYFVDVIWSKSPNRWNTFKREAGRVLCHATGTTFEEAMRNTLAAGLGPGEPAT